MPDDLSPTCPRCGYDQSGIVQTWAESCPLTGLCSECGLTFLWRDLLNPRFLTRPRLFEHAHRHFIRQLFYTTLRAWLPWSFFRWIRMEDSIRLGRVLVVVAFSNAVGTVGYALLLIMTNGVFSFVSRPLHVLGSAWTSYRYGNMRWALVNMGQPWGELAVLWVALTPLCFVVLPQTPRRARVRPVHLIRIALYSFVLAPTLMFLIAGVPYLAENTWVWWKWNAGVVSIEDYLWIVVVAWAGLWVWLWWGWACSRYLRLDRPWAVATAMAVIAGLVSFLALLLTPSMGLRLIELW